jgi:hypothetical protein
MPVLKPLAVFDGDEVAGVHVVPLPCVVHVVETDRELLGICPDDPLDLTEGLRAARRSSSDSLPGVKSDGRPATDSVNVTSWDELDSLVTKSRLSAFDALLWMIAPLK